MSSFAHLLTPMLALLVALAACESAKKRVDGDTPTPTSDPATPADSVADSDAEPEAQSDADAGAESEDEPVDPERAHTVVFADRTSQGYLLMLSPEAMTAAPTREELDAWIVQAHPGRADSGELALLRQLVKTAPHDTDINPGEITQVEQGTAVVKDGLGRREDLLGLHIDWLKRSAGLIDPAALADPIASRELSEAERTSVAGRTQLLLLRGDYRNTHDVRGLRLLQTLVALVAERHGALIFDPDTLETMGPAAFKRRQLTANASNVVDQLAIVPFADAKMPNRLRLATRGMRRFGVPDLELDGLPRDPLVLQRASDLLAGLARLLVDAGQVDVSGLAVAADDVYVLKRRDVDRAYADQSDRLPPRCEDCPEKTGIHLIRREALPTDAREHLTVRVVAPRDESDAADYDHSAWVQRALAQLFGAPAHP